jgi:hypothetical protein
MENKQRIPRTEGDVFPVGQTSIGIVAQTATQVKIGLPCHTVIVTIIYVLTAIDHPIGCN